MNKNIVRKIIFVILSVLYILFVFNETKTYFNINKELLVERSFIKWIGAKSILAVVTTFYLFISVFILKLKKRKSILIILGTYLYYFGFDYFHHEIVSQGNIEKKWLKDVNNSIDLIALGILSMMYIIYIIGRDKDY